MTRERIDELVSLVLEARGRRGFSVSIEIEKHEENIKIFTETPVNGITFTTYTTYEFYNAEGRRVIKNNQCLNVYDPHLKGAEEHIRRLLK